MVKKQSGSLIFEFLVVLPVIAILISLGLNFIHQHTITWTQSSKTFHQKMSLKDKN